MSARLTDTKFKHNIDQLTHGEYTFIEKYKGAWHPILCKHNLCDHIFKVAPANFKRSKYPCPYCKNNGYLFQTDSQGHIDRLITIRCPKKHRFKIYQHQLPDYAVGKIRCPICEKLKQLDPLYIHAHVEFDFKFRGGHLV